MPLLLVFTVEVCDLPERHEQLHTWGSGANLLQTLFREALADQVNLWVCPVVIGQGKKLFLKAQPPPGSSRSSHRSRIPERDAAALPVPPGPPETVTEAVNAED